MTTYFVATFARYVLVDAEDETQARELGRDALHDLYADLRERLGREVPIEIRTVREATEDEIEHPDCPPESRMRARPVLILEKPAKKVPDSSGKNSVIA